MRQRVEGPVVRLVNFVRRREHQVAAAYLAVVLTALVALALSPTRHGLLSVTERILDVRNARWVDAVETGEALLAAGDYEGAAEYLERLDREFPARYVKHAMDRERERLLRALGQAYAHLGRKGSTLDTYRRLVAFDPRNFANHYDLALACLQFDEPGEAVRHFSEVLRINPSHLPSLRHYVAQSFDAAEFREVVAAYERYLDAQLLHRLTVAAGTVETEVRVPVDGLWHRVEAPVAGDSTWTGELAVRSRGLSVALRTVRIEPLRRVGTLAGPSVTVDEGAPALLQEMVAVGNGTFRATGPESALRFELPGAPSPRSVTLTLRLFKPVDREVWEAVEKSYRNLLDYDGLERARSRTLLPGRSDGQVLVSR